VVYQVASSKVVVKREGVRKLHRDQLGQMFTRSSACGLRRIVSVPFTFVTNVSVPFTFETNNREEL
jgi:hypothetical protein